MIAPQRRQNQNQACTYGFIVGAAHSPNMYPRTPIDSGAPLPRMLVVGKPSSGTTLPPRRQARRRRQSPRRIPPCRGQGGLASRWSAPTSVPGSANGPRSRRPRPRSLLPACPWVTSYFRYLGTLGIESISVPTATPVGPTCTLVLVLYVLSIVLIRTLVH